MSVYIAEVHMSGGNGHQHVGAVRWRNPSSGQCGESTRSAMVEWIEDGGSAYVRHGNADVKVAVWRADPPYLRTYADKTWTDNLLALPRY